MLFWETVDTDDIATVFSNGRLCLMTYMVAEKLSDKPQ